MPHLGADDEAIAAAVARLGRPLDGQHETLLRFADGWEDGFQSGDLLSTDEPGQGPLWEHANQWRTAAPAGHGHRLRDGERPARRSVAHDEDGPHATS
ncbi:hypothetical protein ET495_01315 [Xylanimonas allomyrinae]|uniref:Uncharacterized protein n=1 Tax=Xylanimonas allomyrinae TaxID=2509459 RepID=A0A4P6ELJ3_9MICO|nr:hypothetical protein [Xylanimonas allomyrinae]QAY62139.1 hypothetical protein ET495_01315 [Xylanimonas allomyrinae]